MELKINFIFILLACVSSTTQGVTLHCNNTNVRSFPDGFLLGVASAAHQIEGAWADDGKAENIWDHVTHESCFNVDCSNADTACNSYSEYERDVNMLKELGVDHYRFSISWVRLLNESFSTSINQAGLDYYNNLIDLLIENDIIPMVTMYHWDLPQELQELGGWVNPNSIDWFTDYARVLYDNFGDRVKYWITFNEPKEICYKGYGLGDFAPGIKMSGYADYLCTKNVLLSHASAYHLYDDNYREVQGGNVGIVTSSRWYEPQTEEFAEYAVKQMEFELGLYVHPIYIGDWPEIVKTTVEEKSIAQGYYRSRLPNLTFEEIEYIKDTSDFFGLNHYTSSYLYVDDTVDGLYDIPSYLDDVGVITYTDASWEGTGWVKVVPWGFKNVLTWISEKYGNPPIIITENGYTDTSGVIEDDLKIQYILSYMDAMMDAIDEGVNVIGYTVWTLMDNFSWARGYSAKFGLYKTNFTDYTMTARKSAGVFQQIIEGRAVDCSLGTA